jgi:hypothetical protein
VIRLRGFPQKPKDFANSTRLLAPTIFFKIKYLHPIVFIDIKEKFPGYLNKPEVLDIGYCPVYR